ncbi:MAG TPA: hypothetical protein P5250_05030, partial [Bacteroidales bacterium]|nr:hypothetical protein [Bacteroidales bacterium]
KNGRLILYINYNKNGLIKTKESYKYDNQGNKLEEIKWNNDSLIYHKKYTYNSNSYKTEEIWLDNKGKIIQKSVFKLNANGDKIVETVYNNSEQIISTIYYTYNNKKLKTERKTINAKGEIESIKKFSYEYY